MLNRFYREALRPQFHFTARQWTMDRLNPGMREEGWINDLNGLMPFNQMISFPCELTLHTTPDGLRVFRKPIQEIAKLHRREDRWTKRTVAANQTLRLAPAGQLFHITAEVEIPEGARLIVTLRGVPVVLTSKTLESGHKPAAVQGHVQIVELLVDRTSVEAYVNQGEVSSTRYTLPKGNGLSVKAEGGPIHGRD